MGTELIARPASRASDLVGIRKQLFELVDASDSNALSEIAARAEAVRKYEARLGHKKVADQAARLKVECEAAIGLIDLRTTPWGSMGQSRSGLGEPPLPISKSMRSIWRKFGIAEMLGLLGPLLDDLENDADADINTASVHARLIAQGIGWVNPAPLHIAAKKMAREQRISLKEICRRAGVSRDIWKPRSGTRGMGIETAVRIAAIVGVDPKGLVPAGRQQPRKTRKVMRKLRAVKGEWSRAYQLVRLLQEQVDHLGGTGENAELWTALHLAEDFIVARSRGRRSIPGYQAKQAREGICAIVGSSSCAVLASASREADAR